MSKQWGHGFYQGRAEGEELGQLVGQGQREIEFSGPADKLFLLANALEMPASQTREKSGVWWALYVSVVAKEMREIAACLPSVLASFAETPGPDVAEK